MKLILRLRCNNELADLLTDLLTDLQGTDRTNWWLCNERILEDRRQHFSEYDGCAEWTSGHHSQQELFAVTIENNIRHYKKICP